MNLYKVIIMADLQISRFDSQRLIDNREVRIFLSSTFTDMQQERNALLKTFDSLKIEANRRNVTFSVLDLRWGVTDEEARSGKVLSVCLEEIEHSHPFFIGLLGSRYGTAPDISEIEKNPELEERYPWIREDIYHELSITEMEMQYGVLRNDKEVETLFLIKNTPDTQPDDNERLTRLKNKILEQDRFAKTDYSSMEDLCQKVEKAVLAIFDKHFPREGYSRLEYERTVQKAYINSRHGHYQKPIADFKRLDDFLDGGETHLVITGPSGMGKSALIANWLKEKEGAQLSHKIIYHFVCNSFGGSDHRQVLQHICDELYNLYGIKRHEGLNETLEDEAQRILIKAGQKGKPVLIVIDGINQIENQDHSKLLNWLPQAPNSAKYLFSTLEGDETMETFKRRVYPIHQIGTLDRTSRREFVVNYLHNVGKKLTDEQMDRILDDTENQNMLVLKTLLDELICFGIHEKLDSHIDYYLSAPSINDFFDRVLQRMEEDYEEVPQILSLIALSENGLTEDELQAITRLRSLDIHLFYCAFYNHLVSREGLITFGHQYVTDAVWQRYGLEDPEAACPYRKQIIDHISINRSISRNRKISELAFQYYHTGQNEKLYKTILSFEAFRYFNASDQGDATLAMYWRKLLSLDPEKYRLRNYLDLPFEGIPIHQLPYPKIGHFVNTYFGDHKTAFMYSQTFLFMSADNGEEDSLTMADAYNDNGTVYGDMGQYSKALEYHFKALEIREKILGPEHYYTAISYNNIGIVYDHLGNYSEALEYSLKAQEINEKNFGTEDKLTAKTYNNIGYIYFHQRDYPKALEFYYKALTIFENTLGLEHLDTATSYDNIGMVYEDQRNYSEARKRFCNALEIREKVLGLNHPSTASSYNNIGANYQDLKDYPKALEYYYKALAIVEKDLGPQHDYTATTYNNIGMVYEYQGNYPQALEYYFKALEIREKVLGHDHPSTATSYNDIAMLFYYQKNYLEALKYHFTALDIREKVLPPNHPDNAKSYNNIGSVYHYLGDYLKALEYYYKALEILEKALDPNHPNTTIVRDNIDHAQEKLSEGE